MQHVHINLFVFQIIGAAVETVNSLLLWDEAAIKAQASSMYVRGALCLGSTCMDVIKVPSLHAYSQANRVI